MDSASFNLQIKIWQKNKLLIKWMRDCNFKTLSASVIYGPIPAPSLGRWDISNLSIHEKIYLLLFKFSNGILLILKLFSSEKMLLLIMAGMQWLAQGFPHPLFLLWGCIAYTTLHPPWHASAGMQYNILTSFHV